MDSLPNGKFRVAVVYGAGAAMGFTPQQVDAMSLWQFMAALNGFIAANGKGSGPKLSEGEADELFAWIDSGPVERELSTQTYWWDDGPVPMGVVRFTVS